jgi:hypothetical protein
MYLWHFIENYISFRHFGILYSTVKFKTWIKHGWAKFWVIFSQTPLVILFGMKLLSMYNHILGRKNVANELQMYQMVINPNCP